MTKPQDPLNSTQRKYLKGLAHHLNPVLQIGKEGLSGQVIQSLDQALKHHELVKIGLLETSGLNRKEAAREMAARLEAQVVQVIGFKISLYRPNPKKKKRISLPEGPGSAS
jgi:RNA-binding protein